MGELAHASRTDEEMSLKPSRHYDIIVESGPTTAKPNGGVIAMGNRKSVAENGEYFDLIVLCAEEFQPHRSLILRPDSRTRVVYAPNDDAELTEEQLMIATRAADQVAGAFLQGKKVLVTCWEGRNRSGLVTALALHMLSGAGGNVVSRLVRARRRVPALTSPSFDRVLTSIRPRQRPSHGIHLHQVRP